MRIVRRALALVLLCAALTPRFFAHAVSVSAEAAVLLCAETGEVLFKKQAHARLPMASTTKIMTALLTIEAAAPQRAVTVTPEMAAVEGTSMGLLPGDTVTLYALACGMLLSSGNDAANTAAIALCGSPEAFAGRMNARAAEIGMADSHFVTPSGLDDDAHYSTAYDMALLACEALRNPQFARICSSESLRLSYGNPPYPRTLTNHNRLLRVYDGCIGVKTGFTKKSGRCLVSAARRGCVTLVAVTLHDPDDWNDHRAMLDFGFSRVRSGALDGDLSSIGVPVTGGAAASVGVRCAERPFGVFADGECDVRRTVYLQPFLYAPVHAGDLIGRAVYTTGGRTLCVCDLVAADSVRVRTAAPEPEKPVRSRLQSWFDKIRAD